MNGRVGGFTNKNIDRGNLVKKPKRSMGQNFLTDKQIASRIVSNIPEDIVSDIVEIGPGYGMLTQYLVERGNTINAVEIDRELFVELSERFKDLPDNRLKLIRNDILEISDILFEGEPFIISNLPYNISTNIITLLLDNTPMNNINLTRSFSGCILMLQKDMVDRLVSVHDKRTYGKISVQFQLKMEYELIFNVEPKSFFPSPKVMSSVIRFKPSEQCNYDIDEIKMRKLLNMCFSGRRKKLKNCINCGYFGEKITNNMLIEIFREHDILDKRAENVTPIEYVEISRSIERYM